MTILFTTHGGVLWGVLFISAVARVPAARAAQFFSGWRLQLVLLPQGGEQAFWTSSGKHSVQRSCRGGSGFTIFTAAGGNQAGLAAACSMRLERIYTNSGFCLINDAYNASPASMEFALQALKEWAGSQTTIAVLGDMRELGSFAAEGHRRTGHCLASLGINYLVTVGEQAVRIAEGAKEAEFLRKEYSVAPAMMKH